MTAAILKLRKFFISRAFMWLTALFGAVFVSLGAEVAGTVFFVLLISLILVVCDDVMATTLPFLVLCISVLQCYNSFNVFIGYAWLAVPAVAAIVFHFIKYRRRIVIGKSFYGILAVAVAVTLGGVGSISAKDYFGGASLYYIAGLGVGMAICYILIKSQMYLERDYDLHEKFVDIMYIAGLFACFHMLEIYAENYIYLHNNFGMSFSDFFRDREVIGASWEGAIPSTGGSAMLQPGNNISTFIMLCMPFPVYRALKNNKSIYHLATLFFMLGILYLSGSRSGFYLGIAEFAICIIVYTIMAKGAVAKSVGWTLVGICTAAGVFAVEKFEVIDKIKSFISPNEVRYILVERSVEDFISSPVFGKGLGYKGNADLYSGKAGTMQWYHMMIPQVIGSMGAVGILAYGYQIIGRVWLTVKKFSPYVMTLGLSYFGMLLMTQVNPGEFCPLPYELMVVILFIMIENEPDRRLKNKI